jgi:hypothetical protein
MKEGRRALNRLNGMKDEGAAIRMGGKEEW